MGSAMKKLFPILGFCLVLYLSTYVVGQSPRSEVEMSVVQLQSLNYLFGQATIKGDQIELASELSKKLKNYTTRTQNVEDAHKQVSLPLSKAEASMCLNIIDESSFQARHCIMVLDLINRLENVTNNLKSPVTADSQ